MAEAGSKALPNSNDGCRRWRRADALVLARRGACDCGSRQRWRRRSHGRSERHALKLDAWRRIAAGHRLAVSALAAETEVGQCNRPAYLAGDRPVGGTCIGLSDIAGRRSGRAACCTLADRDDLHGKRGAEQPQHGEKPAGVHAPAATTHEVHRGRGPFLFASGQSAIERKRDEFSPSTKLNEERGRIRACALLTSLRPEKSNPGRHAVAPAVLS